MSWLTFPQYNLHQFTLLTAGQLVQRGPDIFYFENLEIYSIIFLIWPTNTSLPPTESILSWDWALMFNLLLHQAFPEDNWQVIACEDFKKNEEIGN